MKYRLSLDLGVSSIGSAIIRLNNQNKAEDLIDAGVRIFPISEGAAERREKRQARKNNARTKQRLKKLCLCLSEKGLWDREDPGAEDLALNKLSPYALRREALNKKLGDPRKIGRIFLHLARHRGASYIDQLTELNEVSDDVDLEESNKKGKKKKASPYDQLGQHLKETNSRTVGEYFYKRLFELPKEETKRVVRQLKRHVGDKAAVDYAIPRLLVKEEFNEIWEKQAQYHDVMQDSDFKDAVYGILFYEKDPAPYAVGHCPYILSEERLPKASMLTEQRRLYESVNNIRIEIGPEKRKLTLAERDQILEELLFQGKAAGKKSIKEVLGLDGKRKIILADKVSGIKPYLYSRDEFQSLDAFKALSEVKQEDLILFLAEPKRDSSNPESRLYREDDLVEEVRTRLSLPKGKEADQQIAALLAAIPKERASLGKTATEKLLPFLKEEIRTEREAADLLVHSGDDRFKAAEVLAQEMQGKYEFLPYYGEALPQDMQPIHPWQRRRNKSLNEDEKTYGKIANPAVHMMLNQLRLVVNDIVRLYGKPYEINLELAREVGKSAKKRDDIIKNQKANQSRNDKAVQALKDAGVKIGDTNILKYKLWEDQKKHDAYDPSKVIHLSDGFKGYEIEHLIPRAKGGSDAYNNLVLVHENENRSKGDLYPYEYFQEKDTSLGKLQQILKAARTNLPDKAWRFESDAREVFEQEGDQDASSRYLTDTSYMSKVAARYLRAILDFTPSQENPDGTKESAVINTRILTVKGPHTAMLRKFWNLAGLEYELLGLDIPRYLDCDPSYYNKETGEIREGAEKPTDEGTWIYRDRQRNLAWMAKPRIDHRHHAVDAITLGCVNRDFMNWVNRADKRGLSFRAKDFPLPLAPSQDRSGQDSSEEEKVLRKKAQSEFRSKVLHLLKGIHVSHKADHSALGRLHEETGRTVLEVEQEGVQVTRYSRKIVDVVKKKSDLSKLSVGDSLPSEWHPDLASDRKKMDQLIENLKLKEKEARLELGEEQFRLKEEGQDPRPVSEGMVWARAIQLVRNQGPYKKDTFPTYANSKSGVYIKRHKMSYVSGNNHRVDFFTTPKGKIGWEVITCFQANQKNFSPEWKGAGGKLLWSLHKGDLIELDRPEQWAHVTNQARCIAEVRKFSENRLQVSFYTDARGTTCPDTIPPDKKDFVKDYIVSDRFGVGLSAYTKHNARKIELTPFGKVKRKHKRIWHGTQETSR